jgi:hypothetical protein
MREKLDTEDTEVTSGKFLLSNPTLALTHAWGGNWPT